ncbi:hypothetical protein [Streptosporangium amethystogenes]|uniref:hypothetical protein n=1 Tax=Streptosporangium amethystogenes TaxID=2002 RepID=UPI0012F79622|nr:hypothetical protein [Streptosporangium amethystogenes]
MNAQVAAEIAEEYLARRRCLVAYAELAVMEENDDKDRENVVGRDGEKYKVLTYVLPDAGHCLRMVVAVNDRSLHSAVIPLTCDAIMRPDGTCGE